MFIKPKDEAESILFNAIKAPYYTILDNANINEPHSEKKGWGLDVITGKSVQMVKAGIIDPLLVTKAALKNAASVATTILSTDCIINNLRVNEGNR
jgi:chaperonin GroEL